MVRDASMINDSCGRNFPWYGSKNQGNCKNDPKRFISKLKKVMSEFNKLSINQSTK